MKKNKSILLVDDDRITQFINKKLLTNLELCNHIVLAANGAEAIRYLNSIFLENFPDIILLDINMPVMDGFEFLAHFSTIYPKKIKEVKIFILTTSSSNKDMKRLEEFPYVSGFIIKPLTKEKMFKII